MKTPSDCPFQETEFNLSPVPGLCMLAILYAFVIALILLA